MIFFKNSAETFLFLHLPYHAMWNDWKTEKRLKKHLSKHLGNGIGFHDTAYDATGDTKLLSDVGGYTTASNILIRVHGALMLASWIGTASIGILLARYYKQTWVSSQLCGKDHWFAVSIQFFLQSRAQTGLLVRSRPSGSNDSEVACDGTYLTGRCSCLWVHELGIEVNRRNREWKGNLIMSRGWLFPKITSRRTNSVIAI